MIEYYEQLQSIYTKFNYIKCYQILYNYIFSNSKIYNIPNLNM